MPRSRHMGLLAVALNLSVVAHPGGAAADPPNRDAPPGEVGRRGGVELEWDVLPGCPTREAVLGRVAALVRSVPPVPVRAAASVSEADGAFTLELAIDGGLRHVTGGTCSEVAEALVVILALAIDPAASVGDSESVDAQVPATDDDRQEPNAREPNTIIAPPPIRARVELRRGKPPASNPGDHPALAGSASPRATGAPAHEWTRSTRFRIGAQFHALGEYGALPGPSAGISSAFRVAIPPGVLEFGGSYLLARSAHVPSVPSKGGDLSWGTGRVAGCLELTAGSGLHGCVGFEVGAIRGRGFGVQDERTAYALWTAPAVAVAYRYPRGQRFAAELRLECARPLNRPEFGIEPWGGLFRPRELSGRLYVGVGWI